MTTASGSPAALHPQADRLAWSVCASERSSQGELSPFPRPAAARRSACRSRSARRLPYEPAVTDPRDRRPSDPCVSRSACRGVEIMPHVPGVRTVRKLLVGLGIGLAFITVFSVFALIYLFRLNAVVRHVAFDPVPGSAAIASVAKDFNQYRVLEARGRRAAESWGMSLTRKAADIERDLKAYDATITQRDDRRRFTELVALWSSYRGLQGETAARSEPAPPAEMALMPARQERASEEINALLTTMI